MIIGIASADYLRADRNPAGTEAWGGSGWARVGQYVEHYRAAGHEVTAGTLWSYQGELRIEDANGDYTTPDVIIMQRIMHDNVASVMKIAKAGGQIIINDLDDWYWGLDPNNQAFLASHPKINAEENTNFYSKNLAASSLLTVSTPYLAERMKGRVNCPIVVVPNYIDVSRFAPVTQTHGVPTFGWAGSTGHRSGDVETVAGVLRRPIQDGTIKFQHSGDHISSAPLYTLLGVEDALVQRLPRTTSEHYPSLLNFDVGIVPLRDTPFNHAKSDIKGLEYAAAGIPFIAQGLPSYAQLHKDWNGAFWLADRPNDWVRGIKKHLDYSYRCERQQELLELVKGRDIAYGAGEWLDVLENVR
jgi:hypothetical protein